MAEKNEDKLPHLAWEIKSGLDLAEKGKQDRIKGLVDAAVALREARSLITADIRFNKWCSANEFGPDVLNAHDRAALIAMGADPERMRSMLSNSERQSARYVYQHEWSAAEHLVPVHVLRYQRSRPRPGGHGDQSGGLGRRPGYVRRLSS